MTRRVQGTLVAAGAVLAIAAGCNDAPVAECDDFDPKLIEITSAKDVIAPTQVAGSWLVPLKFTAASHCFTGVVHATLTASGGQFSSAASSSAAKAGSSDGGAGGDAGASTQGASTTVTLTPTSDGIGLVGYATLLLSNGQLSSQVQIVLGDSTACVLVDATGSVPSVTPSCS